MSDDELFHKTPKGRKTDCIVMDVDALKKEMDGMITEAAEIVQISPGAVRILLNHYKWDMENLLERFYDCSSVDDFLRRARVVADPSKMGEGVEGAVEECTICCCDVVLTGLSCRHFACSGCWEQYLTTKVLVSNTSIIECLYPDCKLLVDDEFLLSIIGSNQSAMRSFSRLSMNCFVEANQRLRWCPAPGCEKAVKATKIFGQETRAVQCSCKCRFCFGCGKECHAPLDCKLLKKWLQKCADDSETSNWIMANTKDCPKCHATIEKNGGCNRITCRSAACSYEFCWMCMEAWTVHGYEYNCTKYDESKSQQIDTSRKALEKYLHYFNRFVNHQKSLELENKLIDTVKDKMTQMQNNGMAWVDVQFLKKAVKILSECRRTLMYTYAFAFYANRTNELSIFEDNQRDLELATEQLSGFLERDMESEDLLTLKQKVLDKYGYVDHRRIILLKHCTEGAERDVWQFNL